MADLPSDAEPGDCARGPDGKLHRFGPDHRWRPFVPTPAAPRLPSLEELEDAQDAEFNRRLRAMEAREAAEVARRRSASHPPVGVSERHGSDDQIVACFEGDFAAVIAETPAGQRVDGWTAERRVLFLDRLAEHGSVRAACRAASMSREAVRRLRARAPAFDAAYREAMAQNVAVLADAVFDRAIHGSERPVYYKGELVGTRTVHHDALACYLLRVRDPLNYAPIDELDRWQKHRPLEPAAAPAPALSDPGQRADCASKDGPTLPT